ncbi:hypothetical protein NPIL_422121 [Nephila pilipes]|uniref:Uncharacterized protein n=1 Tax=Nephila pilipes TaxID=299642 RepID=A0A8X6NAS4_NEPPI|nr:hypothetical protein NPIL_422121 [Nephila pilipes]
MRLGSQRWVSVTWSDESMFSLHFNESRHGRWGTCNQRTHFSGIKLIGDRWPNPKNLSHGLMSAYLVCIQMRVSRRKVRRRSNNDIGDIDCV